MAKIRIRRPLARAVLLLDLRHLSFPLKRVLIAVAVQCSRQVSRTMSFRYVQIQSNLGSSEDVKLTQMRGPQPTAQR